MPAESTLTNVVVPAIRSRRKTSRKPFTSPATTFVASLENTTYRPSAEIWASLLSALAWEPPEETLTRVTTWAETAPMRIAGQSKLIPAVLACPRSHLMTRDFMETILLVHRANESNSIRRPGFPQPGVTQAIERPLARATCRVAKESAANPLSSI